MLIEFGHMGTNKPPCISPQPVYNITAANSASRPARPLAASGATLSRGEKDFGAALTLSHSRLRFYIRVVCTRCSDGMDRHRQEWLDNECSLEVSRWISCFLFPQFSKWHICIYVYRLKMQPVGCPPPSSMPQAQPRWGKRTQWPLGKEAVTARVS